MSELVGGASRRNDLSSLNLHGLLGLLAVVGLAGGLVVWAALFQIAGAVAAPGSVMVNSYAKKVQHQEGGIVKAIHVRDGDVVTEGQDLVELDNTSVAANLAVLHTQIREAQIREARLNAELGDSDTLELPADPDLPASDPEVARLLAVEQQVLDARRTAKSSKAAQLNEQVVQLQRQIEGQNLQREAIEERLSILKDELDKAEQLYAKQLIGSDRVTTLRKDIAELTGQQGRLVAAVAEANAAISERQLQRTQLDQDYLSQVLDSLQETRRVRFDAMQKARAEEERMKRSVLRAPQAGVVHESVVHTVGGVVGAGETLMLIVPQHDRLEITVRIPPTEIQKVTIGQDVLLRLAGFSARVTPELRASVATIAPDLTQDPVTGIRYYSARIAIADGELERLPADVKLLPGMPVEAFIKTADRSVLAYLLKPFKDQLDYALRED